MIVESRANLPQRLPIYMLIFGYAPSSSTARGETNC